MSQRLSTILEEHASSMAPVVPWKAGTDKLVSPDFTNNNLELDEDILLDTNKFSAYIDKKISGAGALYGIGGYDEHRTVYSRSHVFDAPDGGEPRRLHLGVDIWGKPYTPVYAPMDGIIHSFANNDRFGDYGATIILAHQLGGMHFYTLYGHLSLNSIKNLQEAERVSRGDVIGEFGIPSENGQWPPHLHFQVIEDLQGWKGDYPGVCKFSEREFYLNNCPDPDLILRMSR